ncbi:repressor of RNA polymerase III transcription MAF1-like protein [Vairimorpha necatrix]|uniref:Repressor of RNA polymerase III transcription MAF1-like protein n=1 Tax=Vairimorpha necatrix TaxID=6039 RepID=A0AAX4J9U1_9MICR
MKYLQISQILKTNEIFKSIQEKHPSFTIDLEVFSCKSSKNDKIFNTLPKPFRYLVQTLALAYPDYDFENENALSFTLMPYQDVVNELILIIDKTVRLDKCEIFSYKNRSGPFENCKWYFCFFFYCKNEKRILMLNLRSL